MGYHAYRNSVGLTKVTKFCSTTKPQHCKDEKTSCGSPSALLSLMISKLDSLVAVAKLAGEGTEC